MDNIRVKLKSDLTRYADGLLPGIEGYTIGRYGIWSRGSDRFVGVTFPGIATLDILWSSLEIVDDAYLKRVDQHQEEVKEELKTAKDVVKVIGPKGGFRYLSYSYTNKNGISCNTSMGFKTEAEKLIELFKNYGIPIKTEIMY
ncbi:hypothetical protein [Lutispora saccharofermentans]|uniref:Uncharacterized protein n=1 Tax=Lutispora saccharofermentans TaxID=3024236 RepID=A0ABT1ND99_9FIRM|nr:hypothetical protein [Lutispora saccharofermentans]